MASLGRFAATRVLTGALGLLSVVLLARWMPTSAYANYAVVVAAVSVGGIVGSLGIDRVLYRQIPLAHVAGQQREWLRLLWVALLARCAVTPTAAILVLAVAYPEGSPLSLPRALAFAAAMSISFVMVDIMTLGANSLVRFEHQARIGVGVLTLKIAAAYVLHWHMGAINIWAALCIHLAGDAIQAIATALYGIRPVLRRYAPAPPQCPTSYSRLSLRALAKSSSTNYASYLLSLPWQGATSTLIVGAILPPPAVALFALLQSVVDRLRPYLPLALLQTAVEPLLVREYSRHRSASLVTLQAELLHRVNLAILTAAAVAVTVVGNDLVAFATGGRYGDGGELLAVMLFTLAVRGVSGALFIAANVLDEMKALTLSLASITMVVAPVLLGVAHLFGALGVVLVGALPPLLLWATLRYRGQACACGTWRFRKDFSCIVSALVGCALGFLARGALPSGLASSVLAASAAVVTYALMLVATNVFDASARAALAETLRPRKA